MDHFIGIDIGTSSVKSLIMAEDGRIVGTAQVKYDVMRPLPGYAEQDIDVLWEAARDTLRQLARRYPDEIRSVTGIGYSGQMHGLVLVDRDGRPLRKAIIWEDQRSVREIDEIYAAVPRDEFCRVTMNTLSTGFLISSLLWVRNNEPELFERAASLIMIKDYIRMKMVGGLACDTSDASSAIIFDVAKRTWAWDLIDRLSLPRVIFPECREAYEIAGTVRDDVADELGLPRGVTAVYGGGDTLMHEVGTAMISEEAPWIVNIGTSCQVSCAVKTPRCDPLFRTNTFCHVHEDLWMLMSANLCGGAAMKWLSEMIFEGYTYEELNECAESVPAGSEGLLFLPYLNGGRSPDNDPKARAMYLGLTLSHGRRHMIRATMEGVIFSLKSSYSLLREITGKEPEYMIASGGGARGGVFLQMQADAFNKPIHTTVEAEQSCIGAAITAAVGMGRYDSYESACRELIRFKPDVVVPIPENVETYDRLFEVYKRLYPQNRELFERLSSLR